MRNVPAGYRVGAKRKGTIMTDQYRSGVPETPGPLDAAEPGTVPHSAEQDETSNAKAAKQEAAHLAQSAAGNAQQVADVANDRAHDVAETVKEQAASTASEAKQQAQSLYEQGRREISDQAGKQQERLAGGMRAVSSELSSMAESSQEQGLASTVTRQVADYLERAGGWLEGRDPAQVMEEVSAYARRHPVSFMAIAAGLGVLVGRVARSAKDASSHQGVDRGGSGSAVGRESRPAADIQQPGLRAEAGSGTAGPVTTAAGTPPQPYPGGTAWSSPGSGS